MPAAGFIGAGTQRRARRRLLQAIATQIRGLANNAFHSNFVATGSTLTAVPAEPFDSVIWQHNGVDLPASYNSLTETFNIGVDGVADMGVIRLRGVKDGVPSVSPSYFMRQASIAFTAQPSISGSPTIGQKLTFSEGAAGPAATLEIEVLTLGGADKTDELSDLTWDTSDETPGEIRYQVRATNSFGSILSDLITANLAAPGLATIVTVGDGKLTVESIQPYLFTATAGDGKLTIGAA